MIFEVIFDVETKKFFTDIDGFDPSNLGVSIVSLYWRELDENFKEISGQMQSFFEQDFDKMWPIFLKADRIIGFNSIKFDVPALKPYAPAQFVKGPHLDILAEIKDASGHRVSLNSIAKETLGTKKNDSGENAIKYWEAGDKASLAKLQKYCEMDVEITKRVYDYGRKNGHLKYIDYWNTSRTVTIDFSYPKDPTFLAKQGSLF